MTTHERFNMYVDASLRADHNRLASATLAGQLREALRQGCDRISLPVHEVRSILVAVADGGRTHHIAVRLYGPDAKWQHRERTYRKLRRLEGQGAVRRHTRYSAANDIYWERVR